MLVVITVISHTVLSYFAYFFPFGMPVFEKINLIADVIQVVAKEKDLSTRLPMGKQTTLKNNTVKGDFESYKKGDLITDFKLHAGPSLSNFMAKLQALKKGSKRKVRIAYIGDSMIEGDQISSTLRDSLQAVYGGSGVGYLAIHTKVGNFRHSAVIKAMGWEDTSFKSAGSKNLYLSGHYFGGNGQGVYSDKTLGAPTQEIVEKALLYAGGSGGSILVNGQLIALKGRDPINRQVLAKDSSSVLKLSNSANARLYGVSFESEYGVIVDNFSFRGVSGSEFRKLDPTFMEAIQKANHYDLIILHYGANLIYRPGDNNFEFYDRAINPVLTRFKNSFPDCDFLLVSAGDMAFRYNGRYRTALGISELLVTQALLAKRHQFAFYNLFQSMGGEGTIIRWANHQPALAIKDYVHPTEDGSQLIGAKLFKAFQNDYKKLSIQ